MNIPQNLFALTTSNARFSDVLSTETFIAIVADNAKSYGQKGLSVTVPTTEDLENCLWYVWFDEKGFAMTVAVREDGEICYLTKHGKCHLNGDWAVAFALSRGGKWTFRFDNALARKRESQGFQTVAKLKFDRSQAPKGWIYELQGEPDLLFMVYSPNFEFQNMGDYAKSFEEAQRIVWVQCNAIV